jgi:alpha-L-fucosidase 2
MYSEGGNPCIESPLAAANSLQELLLDSWGGRIRVFQGLPAATYPTAVFASLLAEGGIEVTAQRTNGNTSFVQIKRVGFMAVAVVDSQMMGNLTIYPASAASRFAQFGNGTWVVSGLTTGETVLVAPSSDAGTTQTFSIKEQVGDPAEYHYYGNTRRLDGSDRGVPMAEARLRP